MTVAFENKCRIAEELCREQEIAFIPVVAESLGGWHGTRWPWTSSGSWAQPLPDTLARMRGKKLTQDIPDQQQEPAPGSSSIKRWRRGTLQAASVSQNHQISTVLEKAGRKV